MLNADIVNNRQVYYHFCPATTACHAVVVDGTRNGNEIHVNMRWGGTSNAWYDMNNVNPEGREPYNYSHGATFEIQPLSPS